MPSPTAAPTVSSTVGLKNLVIAPVTADTEERDVYKRQALRRSHRRGGL